MAALETNSYCLGGREKSFATEKQIAGDKQELCMFECGSNVPPERIDRQAGLGGECIEGDSARLSASHAQCDLLRRRGCAQLVEPRKLYGLSLAWYGMDIEDTAAADGAGGRRQAKDESVAWDKHDRLGKLDPREANCSRPGCFIAVKRDACHGLGGEGVEVNVGAMLQRRRTLEKPDLCVDGLDGR